MASYEKYWAVLGFAALALGCSVRGETNAAPSTHACSPLEPVEAPIALSDVLVVARGADGTLYVVDTVDYSHRVFVSSGTDLARQRVSGEGELNDGTSTTTLVSFERNGAGWTIGVQMSEGFPTVALAPGTLRSFGEVRANGEALTAVSESALAGLTLHNLPGGMHVEYLARAPTGETVALLSPIDDFRYEDFRVFFGPPERVVERQLENLYRSRSGDTTVFFALDGGTAKADFPLSGEPTLVMGGTTRVLELLPEADFETFSYECLDVRVPPVLAPPDGGA